MYLDNWTAVWEKIKLNSYCILYTQINPKQLKNFNFFKKQTIKVPEENIDLEWKDLSDSKSISVKKSEAAFLY